MTTQDNNSSTALLGLKVNRYARHLKTDNWYLGVYIPTPSGLSDEIFIPNETVSDRRTLQLFLTRRGMTLPSLKDERSSFLDLVSQQKPAEICLMTDRTGWHDQTYVLQHSSISVDEKSDIIFEPPTHELDEVSAGELECWKQHVARPASASSLAIFLICASLAPVIMRSVNSESAIFHVSGPSGVGKTTLTRIAASTWRGGPQAVGSWDTTAAGFQELMEKHNDGFVCLDEISASAADNQARRNLLHTTTYMLATGVTRRRSKHYTGGAAMQSYRLLGLSTGEMTAASIASDVGGRRNRGEEARFLDLPIAQIDTGAFDRLEDEGYVNTTSAAAELAGALNLETSRNHGTAAAAFIHYVVNNWEQVENSVQDSVALFNKKLRVPGDGWERRISSKFALAYAAGILAVDAGILPWSKKLIRICAVAAYRSARAHLETEKEAEIKALKKLKQVAKGALVIDTRKGATPDAASVDNAPALRMEKSGKTERILVETHAFREIGDKTAREAALRHLEEAEIFIKPSGYPRVNTAQKTAVKGARRRSYLAFKKDLLKIDLPGLS